MPPTKEQQAWVDQVLFSSANQPEAPPALARPETDWQAAAAKGHASSEMRQALQASLQGLVGRVCAGADVAALSTFAALNVQASSSDRSKSSATSEDFAMLRSLLDDLSAITFAKVDISTCAKLSQLADAPDAAPTGQATNTMHQTLAVTLTRAVATTMASVDTSRLTL